MRWVYLIIALTVPALVFFAVAYFTADAQTHPPMTQHDRIEAMLCQFRRGNVEVWLGDSSRSGRIEFTDTNSAYLAFHACPKP